MDSATISAITAVRLDDDSMRQRWFELLCRTYDEMVDRRDWQLFVSALTTDVQAAGFSGETVEQFVHVVTENSASPLETVATLREVVDELPVLYQRYAIPETETETGYDESAWNAFLGECGPHWNGEEAAWDAFRTWFVYHGEQRGLVMQAGAFIAHVENQPDKRAAFAEYGIVIAGAEPATAAVDVTTHPELKHGNSGEWVKYLDDMLTRNGF